MNDDQVKGCTSNTKSKIKMEDGKTVGDKSSESQDKVQKIVGKKYAVYGDLKSDLRRLWVVF